MKKNLITAVLMTIATTILFGLVYPIVVTGLAQVIFPKQANGQLIQKDGKTIGSRIIGQGFSGPEYFHSRPSAAGNGYDAANSGGSNLGPTNKKLIDRVNSDVATAQAENPGQPVPIDLVTTSASGFDPHITPAAAEFQLPRVAKERGASVEQLRALVAKHTEERQLGVLGEARVNVLELNLELNERFPALAQRYASAHCRYSGSSRNICELLRRACKCMFKPSGNYP
jgi:potassium-transporting ATPase KdpC subunit